VPHNNLFQAYFFKAKDGLRHATYFTLRLEPQVIQIKEAGIEVVQDNCKRCHEYLLSDPKLAMHTLSYAHYRNDRLCWECHRETPHGRVNSLSSVPYARVPVPSSTVPDWMKQLSTSSEK
jgi:cytochrome c nitrite reductase small subunit